MAWRIIKKIIVGWLVVIGGLVIIAGIIGVILYWMFKGSIPDKTILEASFDRGLIEYVPGDPVARFMLAETPTVRDIVEALNRASDDDRVVALVARVGTANMGLAHIQEVRDAILAFRSKGKPAIAYAETFGELSPGNTAYYLATAFDTIYLQPSGDVNLIGLSRETPFFRGSFEKLGIIPRMDHRQEYKTFMNIFTERKYTKHHREALRSVIESRFSHIVKGIVEARRFSEEEVSDLIDRGPFFGQEAVDAKLVDRLAYRDEVYEKAKEKVGKDGRFLKLSKYLDRAGRPHAKGKVIALIYGVGGVKRGKSGYNPSSGDFTMGSDTMTAAFRAAAKDKEVKAIIFRVNSPGGSYVASDTIRREVVQAKKAGKPVVVSMGNVAGSGGYFVSMGADKIVAQPATITGSIGVLGGKPVVTSEFWDKFGVSWDEVHTSKNSTIWSWINDFTPEQWSSLQNWLDRVYDDFTSKVAEERYLPKQKVLEIAKGRIWTGEEAKSLGLVDELGGFPVALRLAREAAGIHPDAQIHLKTFPKKKSLLDLASEKISGSGQEGGTTTALVPILRMIQPLVRLAKEVGLVSRPEILAMPD